MKSNVRFPNTLSKKRCFCRGPVPLEHSSDSVNFNVSAAFCQIRISNKQQTGLAGSSSLSAPHPNPNPFSLPLMYQSLQAHARTSQQSCARAMSEVDASD